MTEKREREREREREGEGEREEAKRDKWMENLFLLPLVQRFCLQATSKVKTPIRTSKPNPLLFASFLFSSVLSLSLSLSLSVVCVCVCDCLPGV